MSVDFIYHRSETGGFWILPQSRRAEDYAIRHLGIEAPWIGDSIRVPDLVQLRRDGMILAVNVESEAMVSAVILGRLGGKVGGKSRSAAKVSAARANGKKGGRPKKKGPASSRVSNRSSPNNLPISG